MTVVPPPGMSATSFYFGGEWCAASDGRGISTFDPASGQVLAEVAFASAADIADALNAATAALAGPWPRMVLLDHDRA